MGKKFGKFDSVEAFLSSYEATRLAEVARSEEGLGLEARREKRRKPKQRDVVDVDAEIIEKQKGDTNPKDGFHYHLKVKVTKVYLTDPDVDADLEAHLANGTPVFVSIRWGDRMGIPDRIEGLDQGTTVGLKGEYITADRAYAHGGEKLSVLHFTHHPLGYVIVGDDLHE